jgi:dTDP-4-dehydrorhamnose reductase
VGADPIVLVTGADGQVGRALRSYLPHARFLGHGELDVRDGERVRDSLRDVDVVIHLAAVTNVDECERDPELAHDVNGGGTHQVMRAAGSDTRVVYLSTDYVFDGTKRGAYSETDVVRPINVYGHSKLEGERQTATREGNLIVRTSWVYGEGTNFIRTILRAAESRPSLQVVDDQRGRPTHADDIAAALEVICRQEIEGVLHLSGGGPTCSWAELAEYVMTLSGQRRRVDRIDSETYAAKASSIVAPRPANSELALDKAISLGLPVRDWRDAVREYVQELP